GRQRLRCLWSKTNWCRESPSVRWAVKAAQVSSPKMGLNRLVRVHFTIRRFPSPYRKMHVTRGRSHATSEPQCRSPHELFPSGGDPPEHLAQRPFGVVVRVYPSDLKTHPRGIPSRNQMFVAYAKQRGRTYENWAKILLLACC